MWIKIAVSSLGILCLGPLAALAADNAAAAPTLTADQVVAKNIAARGGLEAWRAVQSLSFSGQLEAGGTQNVQLPFRMEFKRPRKSRVEIDFAKDTAIQVYDGANGWKLRPFLNRREVEPFKDDELKSAATESELDGPLVDFAAKGTTVDLEGVEKVDGRDAYKLKLTFKGGQVKHLWIDAQTFLDAKIEGAPRRLDGRMRGVEIYFRDYRSVNGLQIPYVLESVVQGAKQPHKLTIEKVEVNPQLDDALFTRASLLGPQTPAAPAVAAAPAPAPTATVTPARAASSAPDNADGGAAASNQVHP